MKYDIAELMDMLRYCRPAGSQTEKDFIAKFLEPLEVTWDNYGNLYKFIGDDPKILWSSHTDTVHSEDGFQEVICRNGFAYSKDRNCLGADCTTGVWIMMNMIRAEVPGVYIFHREEEIGMRGSSYISKTYDKELREYFDAAIAFDRYGYDSIITHQMMERGCSQQFVESLAGAINMDFKSDDGGVYTDTYSYIDQIPEVTNISVGYFNQHTALEKQDILFAETLVGRMMKFDASKLVIKRDPSVRDMYEDQDWISHYYKQFDKQKEDDLYHLAETVRMYPDEVAKLLMDYGINENDILGTYVDIEKSYRRLG